MITSQYQDICKAKAVRSLVTGWQSDIKAARLYDSLVAASAAGNLNKVWADHMLATPVDPYLSPQQILECIVREYEMDLNFLKFVSSIGWGS